MICEKKVVGGLKLDVEEEETKEHQKSIEPNRKILASNSNNSYVLLWMIT